TGVQALVRLPITQKLRDRKAGLNTGGYISGYRGSPLGTYDGELGKAGKHLNAADIKFVPGVNEDLAATAVWGTQQAEIGGEGKFDGVFSIWYGKGPGVDRSGDVFRHGNLAGPSKHGGVLLLMGDDHTCESSTTCHQSEFALVDANIPILSPSGVQEILDYGLYGWALSRFSGCWVGMKCIKETADATASVDVDIDRVNIVEPEGIEMPADGLHIRLPDTPHAQEYRLVNFKLDAARAFVRANKLDRIMIDNPEARIGIITHGKSYLDVQQAFDELELDDEQVARLGVRLYKVACTWPLEPEGVKSFAKGLDLVIVVEEKRSLLEWQLKEILYDMPSAPRVIGKKDESGKKLFQVELALDAGQVAIAIGERLIVGREHPALQERIDVLRRLKARESAAEPMVRSFYFCSGCPHNSSTVLPEGSKGYAGIGCSWMAQMMDRNTLGYTHMGGEGMAWVGEAPFSKRKHMFQNIGDGTYFHSGLLAIRAAVAANTNITYKILFNDAVAMTGGQKHDGPLTAPLITQQVHAEGVKQVVVVTDEPHKYEKGTLWSPGVTIHHRDELQAVQERLRDVEGVTVLVYDQTCAAEKRRRRKKNLYPDPPKRLVINDLVCEGCGDCGVKSNCVSLVPLETEFGRKRAIDQSSCNKDYSCNKGFCPSFVTVHGGQLRKGGQLSKDATMFPVLPEPMRPSLDSGVYSMIITGVGGTGIVTIGAILGMAAHIDGKACGILDMAGLAQKGGSVWSHIRFGATPQSIKAIRVATGGADLVLGGDMVVAAHNKTLAATRYGKTRMLVNTHEVMTGDFALNPNLAFPGDALRKNIQDAAGKDQAEFVDATRLATAIFGDTVASNMFMLGYAYQRGLIPISADAINEAIVLNGAAVAMNQDAFLWGRRAAQDPHAVDALVARNTERPASLALSSNLDEMLSRREAFLASYQDRAYAGRYTGLVARVRRWEADRFGGKDRIAKAVARYYFKLMAYKDEYEVARLQSDPAFLDSLKQQFEGDYRVSYNLAPPAISKTNPLTGEPKKIEFGPWMGSGFKLLARLKFLRGTAFDPFGYSDERRIERQLIGRYEETIARIMEKATSANYDTAVKLASIPEQIRGYGHVKQEHLKKAEVQWAAALEQLERRGFIELHRAA
ncbi:MAG: indolepyruvate ferredoxin oxidoreductase, partial [Herminiimonas sp.]|nr:indolepyruvate ferredoxin oxidoreductase [Herminiimonas sp.]